MKPAPVIRSRPALAALAGCAVQPPGDPCIGGLPWGRWDAAIAPIAVIVSLLQDGTPICAFANSGVWHDFGYRSGLPFWAGGSHAARRRT